MGRCQKSIAVGRWDLNLTQAHAEKRKDQLLLGSGQDLLLAISEFSLLRAQVYNCNPA